MEFSAPESHVHLGLPALLEFRRARADDEPLVLATVAVVAVAVGIGVVAARRRRQTADSDEA